MSTLAAFVFFAVCSFFLAKREIQIEGAHGWAADLPTWRKDLKVGGRKFFELTGYHLYLVLLFITLFHTAFLFVAWTWQRELRVLSYFLFFFILEDFFWFVFNPAYGIRKFNKENIKWHTAWLLGFPVLYWVLLPVAALFY